MLEGWEGGRLREMAVSPPQECVKDLWILKERASLRQNLTVYIRMERSAPMTLCTSVQVGKLFKSFYTM